MVRLEHAAAVTSSAGLRTNLGRRRRPISSRSPTSSPWRPELRRGPECSVHAGAIRCARPTCRRCDIDEPGVYPLLVNVNGTPDYGAPARLDDARFLLPVLGVPPEPRREPSADALAAVVPPDTSKPVRLTMLWPLGRPAAAGAQARPGGTTPVRLIDDELATSLADRRPARHPAVGGRLRDQPARRPRRSGAQRACAWPSTPTCWSPSTR